MMTPAEPENSNVGRENPATVGEFALLQRYVNERDEEAFRHLVKSQIDLVYSAASRRLAGDAHSAADVTQQVFAALARQGAKLPDDVVLPAWLYATTRHLAANWVRKEQSRRAREAAAHRLHIMNAPSESDAEWEQLRPHIDSLIDELGEKDREAILLRFFSHRTFAQIGRMLQVTEDAARMRVERALEKLRVALMHRGMRSSSAALGGLLAHHAVTAAPAGLSTAVAGLALPSVGGLAALLAFMTWTKITLGLAATALLVTAGFALRREMAPPESLVSPVVVETTKPPAPASARSPTAAPTSSFVLVPETTAGGVVKKTEGSIYPQLSLPEVLGPNNLYYDGVTGVSMTYPPGWVVRTAVRWGDRNRENTVMFTPADAPSLRPSMYYNMYVDGAPPAGATEEFLRTSAQKKEQQRLAAGSIDYKNDPDSFVFREIEGRPSLSYFATFTKNDQVMAEYFMRIVGQKGYVMFFVQGTAAEVQKHIPTVHQMGGTVRVP